MIPYAFSIAQEALFNTVQKSALVLLMMLSFIDHAKVSTILASLTAFMRLFTFVAFVMAKGEAAHIIATVD